MKIIFFTILTCLTLCVSGQTQLVPRYKGRPNKWYPPKNKPCPPFVISSVEGYTKSKITNSDFLGKWLIIDFWNKGCGACVKSLPRMDSLYKKFKGQVGVFFVGIGVTDEPVKKQEQDLSTIFHRLKKMNNLLIPYAPAINLGREWGIFSCPDIVIVDPKGVVRAHTYHVTAEQVDSLLQGQSPHFAKISGEIEY